MKHVVTALIDKLRVWHGGKWKTYDTNSILTSLTLRIHYDQLFILSHDKLVESLNLNRKIKCIYKDDVLIFIICNSLQQVRKIKFQIKTNIAECIHKLSLHLPVVNYNSNQLEAELQPKYRDLEEVFKTALDDKGVNLTTYYVQTGNLYASGTPLPSSFKNFVKLCLLDPTFPQVVNETQDILKNLPS